MKTFLLFLILTISLVSSESIVNKWEQFRSTYKKVYRNVLEERERFNIFQENLKKIEKHNKDFEQGLTTYKMGINHFADLTTQEYLGMFQQKEKLTGSIIYDQLPKDNFKEEESVDWRKKGAVTDVVNQGELGSSAVFSTLGVVESQHFLTNKKLVPLAAQEIVDCAPNITNYVTFVYKYIQEQGIMSAEDYAKQPGTNKCKHDNNLITTKIDKVFHIKPEDENQIAQVVTKVGPVNTFIHATEKLMFYSSGIFKDEKCNPDQLNHSVDIIGYGVEKGVKYWILKNSWGQNWGEKGYVRIVKDVNECGVGDYASYATVYKK